ncbi:hypothetical protein BHE74_00030335 [Ensete ventricosum]|nr:hypothetical protein BHE74_00030335 [Ensete ventricosum]
MRTLARTLVKALIGMVATEYVQGVLSQFVAKQLYGASSKIRELKVGSCPATVVAAKQQAVDLHTEVDQLKSNLKEAEQYNIRSYNKMWMASTGTSEIHNSSSHMSYLYGYRVTLARFRAKHPDLKVEENPFTRLTEDDAVSMEEEVSFDWILCFL